MSETLLSVGIDIGTSIPKGVMPLWGPLARIKILGGSEWPRPPSLDLRSIHIAPPAENLPKASILRVYARPTLWGPGGGGAK